MPSAALLPAPRRAFRAKFGREPNSFAALAYDATMVVAQAIERAGPDRAGIRDNLASLSERNAYQGVTGQIAFQHNGDVVAKTVAMTRVRHGSVVLQSGGSQ